jgi:hypothetical protein
MPCVRRAAIRRMTYNFVAYIGDGADSFRKMSKRPAGRRITIIGTLAYRVIVVAIIG